MTVYIGCDFHPYQQTVAFCDSDEGLIQIKTLRHSGDSVRSFYKQFHGEVIIGLEATSSFGWFENLLFELQIKLLVGHPTEIRRRARSRHKSDKRDAQLLLDLLLKQEFPQIHRPSKESQTILEQLRFRHSLVKQRTCVSNHLQALARLAGLPKAQMQTAKAKAALKQAELSPTQAQQRDAWLALLQDLDQRISKIDDWCAEVVQKDEKAKLLMTHPGVGPLTALCVVHTLGEFQRFSSTRKVCAFVGLDPLEDSSAQTRKIGSISKRGSKLLRFLLVQAAQISIRWDSRLKSFYSQVSRRRGKAIAKVAVARKLLVNLFIQMRDEIDYQEFTRRGVEGSLPE